jgi:hypothetical protein
LLPPVYHKPRRLAARQPAQEPDGQTLQATALVHEAYMRLVPKGPSAEADGPPAGQAPQWESKGHFSAAAAEAMRRILIERVRRKRHRGFVERPLYALPERLAVPSTNMHGVAADNESAPREELEPNRDIPATKL